MESKEMESKWQQQKTENKTKLNKMCLCVRQSVNIVNLCEKCMSHTLLQNSWMKRLFLLSNCCIGIRRCDRQIVKMLLFYFISRSLVVFRIFELADKDVSSVATGFVRLDFISFPQCYFYFLKKWNKMRLKRAHF